MGARRILAIDPGRNTGIAVLGHSLEYVGVISRTKGESQINFAARTASAISVILDGLCDLVYEGVQIYPSTPVPNQDIIELCYGTGFLIGMLTQNIQLRRVVRYAPREWKGQVPKEIHNLRIFEQLDVYGQAKISKIPKGKQEHGLDAVGLALFHKKQVDLLFK